MKFRQHIVLALLAPLAIPAALHSADSPLKQVADISLPGGATRFDYQSLDADAGRLYFSHMGILPAQKSQWFPRPPYHGPQSLNPNQNQ